MKKLLICLSLILVLTLAFVACKDNTQTTDDTTTAPDVTPVECEHQYGEWTADASVECTDSARLYRVCTKCGEKETKADTCSFGEWTKTEGTVCSDANRLTRECSKCGKTEKSADGACTYGSYAVVTAPTCEEAGLSESACSKCGDKVTLEVPAIGHATAEGTEWNVIQPATCTEDGIKFGTCVNCNVTGEFAIPSLGHTANGPATCEEDSVCTVCEATLAAATGHSYTDVADKNATCTEAGFVAGTVCTVCGDTNGTEYAEIPALGHKYTWVETLAPTFSAEGKASATCGACGATDETVLPKKTPALLYTVEDLLATEDAKVNFSGVEVTAGADNAYVTLTAKELGAYLEFLADNFADVISIKYRASATLNDFGGNRDGKFVLNGTDFFASVSGDNTINYNTNVAGQWTLLNIDLRKTQLDLNGVEYDMLNGAAIETLKYVLFNGYVEGASIDVAYIAFFDTKADALAYADVNGEYTMPHVYVETEKSHTTTLNNTNGTGAFGAPGAYLNTNELKGASVINWNGRFYNNYNLKVAGKIAITGGVQKLVYSLDGGITWNNYAEGAVVLNEDGTFTAMIDLAKYEGKTVDYRIAGVVSYDETANVTELVYIINVKKINVTKANPNKLDVNFLAAAGNMADKTNVTATVNGDYVHYTFATGTKAPTVTLYNAEESAGIKNYMLIQYRGNGTGYGTNYDFYLKVNGQNMIGGKKYNVNWLNITLDNTWNYIIVDLSNGGAIDTSAITKLEWVLYDASSIGAANGDWLDVKAVEFFDSYDAAKAVANPNNDYITIADNGSTIQTFTWQGISADNVLSGPGRVPAFTCDSTSPVLLDTVTLLSTDYQLNLACKITAPTVAIPAENLGIKVGDYDIVWGSSLNDAGQNCFGYLLPADFVNGQNYLVTVVAKSATTSEVIFLDSFTLVRQPEGLTIDKATATYANDGTANITLAASAGALEDVVALWKGETLVMYYNAYAGPNGFTANGGANITIADAELAKLTTEGTYTVKLHKGSVNGNVVVAKEVSLVNPGVVGNSIFTAEELYTHWKNFGGAQWGFDAVLMDEGNGQFVRFTPNASNGDGGRIFLNFAGHFNTGWDVNACVGKAIALKYRNHTYNNQLNVCYDGCLAAGGNACGRGWIGTANNGWAMTYNAAWTMTGTTYMVLRFAPGCTIDIESIAFLTDWQGLGGAYDSVYGLNWN